MKRGENFWLFEQIRVVAESEDLSEERDGFLSQLLRISDVAVWAKESE